MTSFTVEPRKLEHRNPLSRKLAKQDNLHKSSEFDVTGKMARTIRMMPISLRPAKSAPLPVAAEVGWDQVGHLIKTERKSCLACHPSCDLSRGTTIFVALHKQGPWMLGCLKPALDPHDSSLRIIFTKPWPHCNFHSLSLLMPIMKKGMQLPGLARRCKFRLYRRVRCLNKTRPLEIAFMMLSS